jgi:sialidase-1
MKKIKKNGTEVLYENPVPELRSKNAYFPGIIELPDKRLMACYVTGEAFESIDHTTEISISDDMGRTWKANGPFYDKSCNVIPASDSMKLTFVGDKSIAAIGYEFFRTDPDKTVGNPKTGGVLEDQVIFLYSADLGSTWSEPAVINTSFCGPVEASAPLTVLTDGSWVTPIASFPNWEGDLAQGYYGRLLSTRDKGKTWNDDAITMEFEGRDITVYEQRLCETQTGKIVLIAWNEDTKTGANVCNHYAVSEDNGKTFGKPMSTGIKGQASSVAAIEGDKILALHCLRRDTDRPGIYAYIVDVSKGGWDILSEQVIWEPEVPIKRNKNAAEVFAFLKFGQPSAIKLSDGSWLMTHWVIEEGQGKILKTGFSIDE